VLIANEGAYFLNPEKHISLRGTTHKNEVLNPGETHNTDSKYISLAVNEVLNLLIQEKLSLTVNEVFNLLITCHNYH